MTTPSTATWARLGRELRGMAVRNRKKGNPYREVDHPQHGSLGAEGSRQQVVQRPSFRHGEVGTQAAGVGRLPPAPKSPGKPARNPTRRSARKEIGMEAGQPPRLKTGGDDRPPQ